MDPGDILIVHPWALHYSGGNATDDGRIAISQPVFGDDIRWSKQEMGGVNEYAKFGQLKRKDEAGELGNRASAPVG